MHFNRFINPVGDIKMSSSRADRFHESIFPLAIRIGKSPMAKANPMKTYKIFFSEQTAIEGKKRDRME